MMRLTYPVSYGPNERPWVCGDSPQGQRMNGTSELQSTRSQHNASESNRQAPSYRLPMCHPRLRDPAPKSRGAWRELAWKQDSDRPDCSTWHRGQSRVRPVHPRSSLQAGRPTHDPLLTGSLAAGETAGPRSNGQGDYPKLESVPSDPRPLPRQAGGEGSGSGCYGGTP